MCLKVFCFPPHTQCTLLELVGAQFSFVSLACTLLEVQSWALAAMPMETGERTPPLPRQSPRLSSLLGTVDTSSKLVEVPARCHRPTSLLVSMLVNKSNLCHFPKGIVSRRCALLSFRGTYREMALRGTVIANLVVCEHVHLYLWRLSWSHILQEENYVSKFYG